MGICLPSWGSWTSSRPQPHAGTAFLNQKLLPHKKCFPYLKIIAPRATTQVTPPASKRSPTSHSSVPTHGPVATTSSFFLPILSSQIRPRCMLCTISLDWQWEGREKQDWQSQSLAIWKGRPKFKSLCASACSLWH